MPATSTSLLIRPGLVLGLSAHRIVHLALPLSTSALTRLNTVDIDEFRVCVDGLFRSSHSSEAIVTVIGITNIIINFFAMIISRVQKSERTRRQRQSCSSSQYHPTDH